MPRPWPLPEPRQAGLVDIDKYHPPREVGIADKRCDAGVDVETGIAGPAVKIADIDKRRQQEQQGQGESQRRECEPAPKPSRRRPDHRMASPAEKIGR